MARFERRSRPIAAAAAGEVEFSSRTVIAALLDRL
jgi:hypothetical protein